MSLRAINAAPATTPGFLNTPPIIVLFALNLFINYLLLPTTIDPTGAKRPLLKQIVNVVVYFMIYFGSIFVSAKAVKILAPSM